MKILFREVLASNITLQSKEFSSGLHDKKLGRFFGGKTPQLIHLTYIYLTIEYVKNLDI